MTAERCSACRTVRDLAELLRVTETGGLHRSRFVCRPNVDTRCFGSVGPRSGEAITTALPEEPLLPRPRIERLDTHSSATRTTGGTTTRVPPSWKTAPPLCARPYEFRAFLAATATRLPAVRCPLGPSWAGVRRADG